MTVSPSLVAVAPWFVSALMPSRIFASADGGTDRRGGTPPADERDDASTDGEDTSQRLGRLIDHARRLRAAARQRRGNAHDHLEAAQRARSAGDDDRRRDAVRSARDAHRAAKKADDFAGLCERRARAMMMSLLHRGRGLSADG